MLLDCGVGEDSRESLGQQGEIQTVNPKGNQSWIFTGRTDAETEAPIFGHLMWRADSLEKALMLGKIGDKRRRGQQRMVVGWHHWLIEREFQPAPGDGEGQEDWYAAVGGVAKTRTWLGKWITTAVPQAVYLLHCLDQIISYNESAQLLKDFDWSLFIDKCSREKLEWQPPTSAQ